MAMVVQNTFNRTTTGVATAKVPSSAYYAPIPLSSTNCIVYHGGIDYSELCSYINIKCRCVSNKDYSALTDALQVIYKEVFNKNLIKNYDRTQCECFSCNGHEDDAGFMENSSLIEAEKQLIRVVVKLFCQNGCHNKSDIFEKIKDIEFVIDGEAYSYDELIEKYFDYFCPDTIESSEISANEEDEEDAQ